MAMIMIVDDSSIIRRSLREILEESGHEVVAEAQNGEEALELYRSHRIDLVTMDIQMPGKSGIEAVRTIKAFDPEARIVMISSVEQRNLIYEAIKLGAKHYIIKPFTREKVDEVMKSILPESLIAVPAAKETQAARDPEPDTGAAKTKSKTVYEKIVDPQAIGLPFDVSMESGKIIFTLYKYVTEHTLPYLAGCLQGLLHIYNAKYVIVLEKVSVSQDAALQPFIDFIRIVLSRRGTVAVVAEENNQYVVLKSKLNTEVYRSVKEISWY
ncbi:response regulator [Cohnella panacarvi]|uniref:response regulator n=1 Tax=Cohnella panacarvi TaxID=400776 RepID=UPI000478A2BB|nr:response regulator [Cohnella panacarvi]